MYVAICGKWEPTRKLERVAEIMPFLSSKSLFCPFQHADENVRKHKIFKRINVLSLIKLSVSDETVKETLN